MKLVVFLVSAISVFGQVTTGSISGYVLDPSGRPIPNAKVTASDLSHSSLRYAMTDGTGYYRISDLSPSRYRLVSVSTNFAPTQAPDVLLEVDAQVRVDFKLPI